MANTSALFAARLRVMRRRGAKRRSSQALLGDVVPQPFAPEGIRLSAQVAARLSARMSFNIANTLPLIPERTGWRTELHIASILAIIFTFRHFWHFCDCNPMS